MCALEGVKRQNCNPWEAGFAISNSKRSRTIVTDEVQITNALINGRVRIRKSARGYKFFQSHSALRPSMRWRPERMCPVLSICPMSWPMWSLDGPRTNPCATLK